MADSLKDQLLKQGLASKKQARAADADRREKSREQRKSGQDKHAAGEAAAKARQDARERAERDRAKAEAEAEARQRKESEAQVRDLVRRHAAKLDDRGDTYHFTHGTEIRELRVPNETRAALGRGRAAIVQIDGAYHVVPSDAAARIRERLPEAIVVWHEPDESKNESAEDDPYAEFQVPDDLMW